MGERVALQQGGEPGVAQLPGTDLGERARPAGAQQPLVRDRRIGFAPGQHPPVRPQRLLQEGAAGPVQVSRARTRKSPQRCPAPAPSAVSRAATTPAREAFGSETSVPSANTCRDDGSTWTSRTHDSSGSLPVLTNRSRQTAGSGSRPGPVSKENPSRSKRPRAPPYVRVRSYTTTRWPATASRAAAAMAPIPAPITAIRAMPGTLSAATDTAVRGLSTKADVQVTGRRRRAVSRGAQG
ncbi:hypothetical protein STENM327S_05969 [Streptomyces tendae]